MESENDFTDTQGLEKVCVPMLTPDDVHCRVAIKFEAVPGQVDDWDTVTGVLDSYTVGARYDDDGEPNGVVGALCILVDDPDDEHPTGGMQPFELDIDEWFMIQRDGEPTPATGNHE